MRISDWSSDVCSSDLSGLPLSRENVRLFPLGDLLHRPPGLHARQARLDQRVGAARLGIADLAQQPVLARFIAARLQPDQQPFALHPLAIEDEVERSEEHTSELQSLMRISYDVFYLKRK